MKRLFRAGAVLVLALPFLFAQSPLTVTPTRVSVQLGQPLYCAAAWIKPQVQVYCYTSSVNHTWDLLIYNSVFPVNTSGTVPYVLTCPLPATATTTPGCTVHAGILWMFTQDPTTAGVVHWQVAWNGTGSGSGTFQ